MMNLTEMLSSTRMQLMIVILVVAVLQLSRSVSSEDMVQIKLDPLNSPQTAINPLFLGFSLENGDALNFVGRYPNVRNSYVQLMMNLKNYTNSAPLFRIGGNSADLSWWNPNGLPKPPGITYDITSVDLLSLQEFAAAIDGYLVLSSNFRQANNASFAVSYASGIASTIGWDRIFAFEIGNEVDLYWANGIRTSNFTYADYKSEWENYAQALYSSPSIQPPLPNPLLQGGVLCGCNVTFDLNFPDFISSESDLCKTVSFHRYPESSCGDDAHPTMEILLSDASAVGQTTWQAPWVAEATSVGNLYWEGEMNSVSCEGANNISNVFGVALWAVDIMFNFANISISGVNYHGVSASWFNTTFLKPTYYDAISYDNPNTDVPTVHPLYYGILAMAQAIQGEGSIIPSSVSSTNELIKIWTLLDKNNTIRLVAIHKNLTSTESATVSVSLSESSTWAISGELTRLEAPSVYSPFNVTLAGQTFDGSQDGTPVGDYTWEEVQVDSEGVYNFILPPLSIAILTIPLM